MAEQTKITAIYRIAMATTLRFSAYIVTFFIELNFLIVKPCRDGFET